MPPFSFHLFFFIFIYFLLQKNNWAILLQGPQTATKQVRRSVTLRAPAPNLWGHLVLTRLPERIGLSVLLGTPRPGGRAEASMLPKQKGAAWARLRPEASGLEAKGASCEAAGEREAEARLLPTGRDGTARRVRSGPTGEQDHAQGRRWPPRSRRARPRLEAAAAAPGERDPRGRPRPRPRYSRQGPRLRKHGRLRPYGTMAAAPSGSSCGRRPEAPPPARLSRERGGTAEG